MPGPVVSIDQMIQDTAVNIALISYDGFTQSLKYHMDIWVAAIFGPSGVFPRDVAGTAGTRSVSNWQGYTLQANAAIEGAAPGASTVWSTSLVQDAVVRVGWATKMAYARSDITPQQLLGVIAAFNAAWVI